MIYNFYVQYNRLKLTITSIKNRCYRSSHPEVFYEKGMLWNFAKFTGKHLSQRKDSDTEVCLWILPHFQSSFFYRTLPMATYGVNTNSLLQPLFLFFECLLLLFDQMFCNTWGISTFNELCTLFWLFGKPYNKTRQNLHVKIKQKEIQGSILRIWSHLLKKSFMENFIFFAVDLIQGL